MRRSLVITDEAAGNRFLASLPPHVRSDAKPLRIKRKSWFSIDDLRHFLAASLYIA